MKVSPIVCNASLAIALVAMAALNFPARAVEAAPVAKAGFSLTEARIGDAQIPALLLSKEGGNLSKRPVVILIHGGAIVDALYTPGLTYKEQWFRPVYEDVPYGLAEKGMLVVSIDAAWAESRLTPEVRQRIPEDTIEAIMTFYMAAVRDVSQTIDYVCTLPNVDPDRIGVAGKSGGAIVSLMAACHEPRLKAVVSWKGGANYPEMMRRKGETATFDRSSQNNPAFRKELDRVDPINCFEKIPPKALALINNRDDPAIPRENAEELYEKLRPLYEKQPERLMLKLVETSKPTHDDQIEAFEAGCQWLEKHLLP